MHDPSNVLRNSFPGPRLAGVACILAPALLMAGAYLLHPTAASPESHMLSYLPDPARAPFGITFFMSAVPFAAIAGVALARLAARTQPTLAAVGGFLVLCWAGTSAYFGGVMWVEVALASVTDEATSRAVAEATGMMPIPAFVGTLGLLAGWGVLALAAWRARILGAARAIGLGAVCLVPVAVAYAGLPMFAIVPFVGMAFALVPLGLELLRGGAGADTVGEARSSA